MKNDSKEIIKNNKSFPILIGLFASLAVLIVAIGSRMGTYPYNSSWNIKSEGTEWISVIIPIVFIIIPIFFKSYRKNYWSKANIIATIVIVLINLLLLIITAANKHYYLPMWENASWAYGNSPPIRWDIWNII